jgi:hypothetical protein
MREGDTIQAEVNGTVIALMLYERVVPDPSAYQWEAGFFAITKSEVEYFVSDDGSVYKNSPEHPGSFDVSCGKVIS